MKELLIEEKARCYDEAIEKANELLYVNDKDSLQRKTVEHIFPQLKESEDERIRKDLIIYLRSILSNKKYGDKFIEDWIVWLEKIGEHLKFCKTIQIGDRVTRNEGGVLVNMSQLDRIAKKRKKQGEQKHTPKHKVGDTIYYNSFGELKSMIVANVITGGTDNPMYEDENGNAVFEKDLVEQKPANWFQELEDKLANATPKQLAEWKEKYFKEEPAEWSEEDDIMVHDIDYALRCQITYTKSRLNCMSSWIGSLKYRVQSKREILEKLEEWLDKYVSDLADVDTASLICSFKNYLDGKLPKSFRHRSQWKPTDEQMDALRYVTNFDYGGHKATLVSLYEQLKKLRGE